MTKIVCPSCHKKFPPPDGLAGRRVKCPRCETFIAVPIELVQAVQEAGSGKTSTSPDLDMPFPLAARLGVIALILGMISFILLCAPVVSYVSIGLSSVGLLLGLGGLFRARRESESLPPSIAGGVGIWNGFGTRVRDYPLAGLAACFVALLLALAPTLMQWLSDQQS